MSSGRPLVVGIVVVMAALVIGMSAWLWVTRVPAIPGMLYFPAGTFMAGPDKKQSQLGAFYLDEAEVTNAEFAEFCRATSCTPPSGAADLPVVHVTIAQARSFAQWKGKRLPTALEWERGARGTAGSRYPWGDAEDSWRANVSDNPKLEQHTLMPVKSFGIQRPYQMIGNAWEIVEGNVIPSEADIAKFKDLLNPPPTEQEQWIEIRGGSFNTPIAAAVTYQWSAIPERYSAPDIGFRCAKSP